MGLKLVGIFQIRGNGNSDSSSKTNPSFIDPSSNINYDSSDCNPSDIDFLEGASTPLLYYFISTPAIVAIGAEDTSGDNSAFDIKSKSDTITGNDYFIRHDSVHANKNNNSMYRKLVLKINYS